VDDSGKEVEVGRAGEMVVRGANVMHGYWNNPKETELSFRNELFRTGDIGYQDADRAVGVDQGIAQLSAFMNRARCLRSGMTRECRQEKRIA
jgi:acyl-CoA synthetase (AMP-forming)/AMP-acid ligase II